jgi:transcription initiation protein SPT3
VLDDDVVAGSADDGNTRPSGKIPSVTLPWDIESFFRAQVPEEATIDSIIGPASLEKLRKDDKRTQGMSVAEYATWSEYRHASFTSRKMKRFREWSGLGKIADHRPNDDVLDILGFLTSEMVQNLTEEALDIQSAETKGGTAAGPKEASPVTARTYTESGQLFAPPLGIKTPLQKSHVQLAFQRMQARKKRKSLFKDRSGKRPRLVCTCEYYYYDLLS